MRTNMARSQNVFRSPPIPISGQDLSVSFKLNHKAQFVRCAVRGKRPFRVYAAFGKFEAAQKGSFKVTVADTPAQAFASGVELFWETA